MTDQPDIQAKYGGKNAAEELAANPAKIFSISLTGLEGTGKSQFPLLTCPTPIVYVNIGDRSHVPLLYDMSEERLAQVKTYSLQASSSDGWTREEGRKSIIALAEIAKFHLKDGGLAGGTFILDGGSTWWSIVQDVHVAPKEEALLAQGKKKAGGYIYGEANLLVAGVLNWIKAQGAFFIITHKKAQEWDKEGPIPGKYRAQQNNGVPFIVEVVLDLTKECGECSAPQWNECKAHVGRKHFGQFIKLGNNTGLEGLKFENPTFEMVYGFYAGQAFPEKERLK